MTKQEQIDFNIDKQGPIVSLTGLGKDRATVPFTTLGWKHKDGVLTNGTDSLIYQDGKVFLTRDGVNSPLGSLKELMISKS